MIFDPTPFIGKFTQEARELIQKLNEHLMLLEKTPDNQDVLRELMRTAHTLKGSAKILQFQAISRLAHRLEDVLSSLYERRIASSGKLLDVLFAATDLLTRCVDAIGREDAEAVDSTRIERYLERVGCGDIAELDTLLPSFTPSQFHSQAEFEPAPHPPEDENAPDSPSVMPPKISTSGPLMKPSGHQHDVVRIDVHTLDNVIRLVSEMAVSHRKSEHELQVLKDLLRIAQKHATQVQQAVPHGGGPLSAGQKAALMQESQSCVALAERLLNERREETAFVDLLLNELYDDVLTMRMLPLATVFQSFPRAVRDMARHGGKQIDFQIQGEETTLDKKIIEKLGSPLMHLLRNCIDHGIETPEERRKLGKAETGSIRLQARQHSGHVEIDISDDGGGIQVEKLRQRLVAREMFSDDQVRHMTEDELLNTIFLPGISTSDMITDMSGRGFGMDIVKTEIEALKGSVTLTSHPGQGARCLLTLPVTLTTIRCLTITVSQHRFAVPIDSLEESVHVLRHECIQVVDQEAIRLRNQMVYVVSLADVLDLPGKAGPKAEKLFVLITHAAGKRVGLIVDDIVDEQDVVVKQLPTHMRHAKSIAGATIFSDNTVTLILHVPEIVKLAGHMTQTRHESGLHDDGRKMPDAREGQEAHKTRILLVEDSVNTSEIERFILAGIFITINRVSFPLGINSNFMLTVVT